ncbi:hypothetical protein ACU6VI_10635 [Sphaerotilus natans]|uniref:hypothetical protein n=1 Tax=Sphaerotilus natans TaxID=34103 RepID=UPI00406C92AF
MTPFNTTNPLHLALIRADAEQAAFDAPANPHADLTPALARVLAAVAFAGPGETPSRSACLLARGDALELLKARLSTETLRALSSAREVGPHLHARIAADLTITRRPA